MRLLKWLKRIGEVEETEAAGKVSLTLSRELHEKLISEGIDIQAVAEAALRAAVAQERFTFFMDMPDYKYLSGIDGPFERHIETAFLAWSEHIKCPYFVPPRPKTEFWRQATPGGGGWQPVTCEISKQAVDELKSLGGR